MSYTTAQPPAGWYPDPAGSGGERFWDGTAWSQATRDAPPPMVPAPEAPRHQATGQVSSAPQGSPFGAAGPSYQVPQGQTPVRGQGGRAFARFGKRLAAWALDYLLTFLLVTVTTGSLSERVYQGLEIYLSRLLVELQEPTGTLPGPPGSLWTDYLLLVGAIAAIHIGYRVLANGLLGSTLGERVMKLGVAKLGDESLGKIGWPTAIWRGLFSGLFITLGLLLGFLEFLFAAFTQRRQALHDMVAKTVVYER